MSKFRLLEPWRGSAQQIWWFRRRVPAVQHQFGMPEEFKFSLETKD